MPELIVIAFIAFVLDMLIGDPPYRYHPIRVMGWGISLLERALMDRGLNGRGGGAILLLTVELLILSAYFVLSMAFSMLHLLPFLIFNLFLCYSCLALGDLLNQIKPVMTSLKKGDIVLARGTMAMLVGRDVKELDDEGLGRAAVETMAENFVDGFVSPLFWYLSGGILAYFLGLPVINTSIALMLIFKGASTLDSMVGYKTKRYIHFGWAGAKLDDLMNFLSARMSLFFLFFGAWVTGLEAMRGIRIALRDRLKHDSPNAAHAESFVAGALGIRLGGPIKYPDGLKNKPWLGDGTPKVGTAHIKQTATLLRYAAWITIMTLLTLFYFIYYEGTL
ncbi:MAG: adenosylcobinamide-phosphate synthase CbiB [Pseudomonadota bacterium]